VTIIRALTAHILSVILLMSVFLPQIMSRGYATLEEPDFTLSPIRVQDIDGNNLGNIISPGKGIVLAFDVTNEGISAQPYVGLIQISNEAGTIFFALRTGMASPGESISLDFAWQAEKVGRYTVTAFVWTSLDAATALSEPSDMVITTSLDAPTALSEPSDPQTVPDEDQDVGVSITSASSNKTSDAYAPSPITINVGYTVTWTNDDGTPHTVTSGTNSVPDGKYDSSPDFNPVMAPQQTFSHTFTETGEYQYYCGLHPNMVGTVIVV
jgi:plastocyanin